MTLPWQARGAFRLTGALAAVGLAPDATRLLASPMAKRLGTKPPKGLLGRIPDVVTEDHVVTTRDRARLRLRSYRKAGSGTSIPVLYLHGGGFVVGGIASCDHICRRLAAESGAAVFSLEYRLAPEHPYPGPLHDAYDAAAWVVAGRERLGVDVDRLVVAGDSAGGNLAAALSLTLRDEGRAPARQVLLYPILDLTLSGAGVRGYRGVGLTLKDGQVCASNYLAGRDPADPYASPLLAPDFRGLPATFVLTVGHDALREEGQLYAERCRRDAVPVVHLDLPDHAHASLSLPRLYRGVDELYSRICGFMTGGDGAGSPGSSPLSPSPESVRERP